MNKIYFFDFDGTILKYDSFVKFSFFSVSLFKSLKYWLHVCCYILFHSKGRLKEFFFLNFENLQTKNFNSLCFDFYDKKIKKLIKKSFVDFIEKMNEDSKVVVVSASISNYLKPWCDEMGFDLISTELEVIDGKLTGKFLTPNCNGKEKVRRIKEKYNLKEFDEIHVFGNSKGDFPMLELGTHKYYRFFK